jgi:hypothetical protein
MTVEIGDGIEYVTGLICEDVRAELYSKWTLLGVFSGNIAAAQLPAQIRIGLFLEINVAKDYRGPLFTRICLKEKELVNIKGELDAQRGPVAIAIGSFLVQVPETGILSVQMGLDGKNWKEVLSKEFILGTFKNGVLESNPGS